MLSEIQQEAQPPGRWVLMPRPDERFVGKGFRSRVRARERRRRVVTVLGEAVGFTALMGAFPPLRPMWALTGVFAALLGGYVLLLLKLRTTRRPRRHGGTVRFPDEDVAVLRLRDDSEARASRGHAAAR